MKKKRKGSDAGNEKQSDHESRSSLSSRQSHISFEDYARLKRRCREKDVGNEPSISCTSRRLGVVTAPALGSSSLVAPGRGHKRKIGCIDVAMRIGRKNKLEDDYELDSTIGQGKFGSVWLCRCKTSGAEFACKTLRKGEETVQREVEIMQHLSGHGGVVTLHAVYEDSDCFHLVMELCSGGRLIDHITKEGLLSEQRAASIMKELMVVIKYCHEMGVVHRDIKPENILLTTAGKMKLADFGLAMRVTYGQKLNGLAGSPAYVAPEVLLGNYSEKVDIWSAGILLHLLLVDTLPFQGDSLEAVFEAIKNVKLDFNSGPWASISKPARNLVERMLTRDTSARITAEEVQNHPWILFYTDRVLKSSPMKLKSKNGAKLTNSQLATASLNRKTRLRRCLDEDSTSSCGDNNTSDEDDDCSLVDALTDAISHVRISEPKRSRLCSPTTPIPQQCSSNMKSNSLCKAF
ncbi:hypothetical protein QQ045_013861 [Rhodiola kirilowii]